MYLTILIKGYLNNFNHLIYFFYISLSESNFSKIPKGNQEN